MYMWCSVLGWRRYCSLLLVNIGSGMKADRKLLYEMILNSGCPRLRCDKCLFYSSQVVNFKKWRSYCRICSSCDKNSGITNITMANEVCFTFNTCLRIRNAAIELYVRQWGFVDIAEVLI